LDGLRSYYRSVQKDELATILMNQKDEGLLTTFPTPHPESIASLLKQLHHFVRPSGKKPALPLSSSYDLNGDTGSPDTPQDEMTLLGSDEEDDHPRKRSKANDDGVENQTDGDGHRHGKKPGGKTAGKGTKPRTVVRGVRGLVPMEIDADGGQHVAGRLPESAIAQDGGEVAIEEAAEAEEEEEEDIPLAQRPQLDEGERRRREVIKEKAREREEEVVRRLTNGVNAEDTGQGLAGEEGTIGIDVWEGVELVSGKSALHVGEIAEFVVAPTPSSACGS
jgi:histone acetyltransferase